MEPEDKVLTLVNSWSTSGYSGLRIACALGTSYFDSVSASHGSHSDPLLLERDKTL